MKLPLQHLEVSIATSLYCFSYISLTENMPTELRLAGFFLFFFLHVHVVLSEFAHKYSAAFFKSHIDSVAAAKRATRLHVDNKTEFTPFFKTTKPSPGKCHVFQDCFLGLVEVLTIVSETVAPHK